MPTIALPSAGSPPRIEGPIRPGPSQPTGGVTTVPIKPNFFPVSKMFIPPTPPPTNLAPPTPETGAACKGSCSAAPSVSPIPGPNSGQPIPGPGMGGGAGAGAGAGHDCACGTDDIMKFFKGVPSWVWVLLVGGAVLWRAPAGR